MSNKFINSEKNDSFVFFRGLDLQELLLETEKYLLEYRNKLNLPKDITFGAEIEYEHTPRYLVTNFIANNIEEWNSYSDSSLNSGGEINSTIMYDKEKYWKQLKMICNYLESEKADTLHNAGGHIHVGVQAIGDDVAAWRNFLKLYMAYESVIFRFIYGDKISAREKIKTYAPPLADKLYAKLSQINQVTEFLEFDDILHMGKYYAINFNNVPFNEFCDGYKNTIEFRSPNSSTSEVIWQNNINTFTKMLIASKAKVIDEEFLDYKLKNEYIPYKNNEHLYNNVRLKNVLEFVDLVFDNNLDKIYFLRQYLKNLQDNYNMKEAVYAKKFVK